MYNGISYTLGGIYRHPGGNVSQFVSSLETISIKLNDRKNDILAGDMNIDLIKQHQRKCSIVHVHNVTPVFALSNAAYSYHPIFYNLY